MRHYPLKRAPGSAQHLAEADREGGQGEAESPHNRIPALPCLGVSINSLLPTDACTTRKREKGPEQRELPEHSISGQAREPAPLPQHFHGRGKSKSPSSPLQLLAKEALPVPASSAWHWPGNFFQHQLAAPAPEAAWSGFGWDRRSEAGNQPQALKSCPARSAPRVSSGWHPSSGPQAPGGSNPALDAAAAKLGTCRIPAGAREVTGTRLPAPSAEGPRDTPQQTASQALREEGDREGRLQLPLERGLHKQVLDPDRENALIPPPGQASWLLPAPPSEPRCRAAADAYPELLGRHKNIATSSPGEGYNSFRKKQGIISAEFAQQRLPRSAPLLCPCPPITDTWLHETLQLVLLSPSPCIEGNKKNL